MNTEAILAKLDEIYTTLREVGEVIHGEHIADGIMRKLAGARIEGRGESLLDVLLRVVPLSGDEMRYVDNITGRTL